MPQAESPVVAPSSSSLATLEAMAQLAAQSGTVVHVVVPREKGVVHGARELADIAGIGVCVDVMAATVRLRFDGQRP